MDKELRSIIFTMIRFGIGFILSVLGFIFMSQCVAAFFIRSSGLENIHMGIVGLCIFTVGEQILSNVCKQLDEEVQKEER